MENTQSDLLTHLELEADSRVRQQLYESSKWGRFISVVMFILAGFILLAGIIGGASLGSVVQRYGTKFMIPREFSGPLVILLFVFIAAIIAVIYYFLYNFSARIKNALIAENRQELNAGLKSLKIYFIITSVVAALSLVNSIINLF